MVTSVSEEYSMARLKDQNEPFRLFPYAIYATDVSFQQSFTPSGDLEE